MNFLYMLKSSKVLVWSLSAGYASRLPVPCIKLSGQIRASSSPGKYKNIRGGTSRAKILKRGPFFC